MPGAEERSLKTLKNVNLAAICGSFLIAVVLTWGQARAATFTTLFSFDGTPHGRTPYGGLTLSGSTLYGMTNIGGMDQSAYGGMGDGAIFSEPVTGGTPTMLFDFDLTHGVRPWYGNLALGGSTLYGMTPEGGANNDGVIFSEPVGGGTPTILFSFDSTHGSNPFGGLVLSGSTLYGMTLSGGANGQGTIFSEPVTGGTPTVLYSLDWEHGTSPNGTCLTLSGSTLYGMTAYGGANNYGTIFSEPVSGGTPSVLFNFDGNHGSSPIGSLTLSGSTLYGMTWSGGIHGLGTIFSEPVTGGTPSVLYDFDGSLGSGPEGSLTLSGSVLYGMTVTGGTYGGGTIFSEPITGGTPTVIYNFDGPHGANPFGDLTLDDSTLYGMTALGGAHGYGTVFSVTVPEPSTFILLVVGFASFPAIGVWRRRRGRLAA